MKVNKLILFLFLLIVSQSAVALTGSDSLLVDAEQSIAQLSARLSATRYKDALQDSLSVQISDILGKALEVDGSFNYPFDSIKNDISVVSSTDGRLRIFTWFSVGDAGNYRYYGFLQYSDKSDREVALFKLNDCSDDMEDVENQSLSSRRWFGMMYYAIVETKISSETIYTLLGWDGCGLYTTKKIVEPLTFNDFGEPRFGKPMIKIGRRKISRLVFEYTKRASMMIQYDASLDVIVMDHLTALGTQDTDNPMFFAPDMSYDALKFEDGMWLYQPNIQYMRPKTKRR